MFTKSINMKKTLLIIVLFTSFYCLGQEITMFDEALSYRFYQDENRINFKEVNQLMLSDSISVLHWKRAKTKSVIIDGLLISQLAVIIAGSSNRIKNKHVSVFASFFFLSSFASIGLVLSRQKSRRKAILRYNSLFDPPEKKPVGIKLEVGPTLIFNPQNGNQMGLKLTIK